MTPEEHEWLKRRRSLKIKTLVLGPLVGFPLAVLVSAFAGSLGALSITIAAASVVLGVVFGLQYQLARCPHCQQPFMSIPGKWHFLWYTRQCRHCGFPEEQRESIAEPISHSERP